MIGPDAPYRILRFFVVSTLVTAMLLPLVQHVCLDMDRPALAEAQDRSGPSEACPSHADSAEEEQPLHSDQGDACCLLVADRVTERSAVTSLDSSTAMVAVMVQVLADWQLRAATPITETDLIDSGPPPDPVRPHLAHSVLLI